VIVGGVITSTLLVLFVLPSMYRMHGFVARRDRVAEDLIVLHEAEVEVERTSGS
jgi:hypothetical protein